MFSWIKKIFNYKKVSDRRRNYVLRDVLEDFRTVSHMSIDYCAKIERTQKSIEMLYHQEKAKARNRQRFLEAGSTMFEKRGDFIKQIEECFRILNEHSKADRFFAYKKDGDYIDLVIDYPPSTYIDRNLSVADIEMMKRMKTSTFPNIRDILLDGRPVFVSRSNLSAQETILMPDRVQHLCVLPIINYKDVVWGCIGMSIYHEQTYWTDDEKKLIHSFAKIITGCLEFHGEI